MHTCLDVIYIEKIHRVFALLKPVAYGVPWQVVLQQAVNISWCLVSHGKAVLEAIILVCSCCDQA